MSDRTPLQIVLSRRPSSLFAVPGGPKRMTCSPQSAPSISSRHSVSLSTRPSPSLRTPASIFVRTESSAVTPGAAAAAALAEADAPSSRAAMPWRISSARAPDLATSSATVSSPEAAGAAAAATREPPGPGRLPMRVPPRARSRRRAPAALATRARFARIVSRQRRASERAMK